MKFGRLENVTDVDLALPADHPGTRRRFQRFLWLIRAAVAPPGLNLGGKILLVSWGAPTLIIGLLVGGIAIWSGGRLRRHRAIAVCVTVDEDRLLGRSLLGSLAGSAVSLGSIIVCWGRMPRSVRDHELGHTWQSLLLGPTYLLVVGVPSLIHAAIWRARGPARRGDYYERWPESWADRLGGVSRSVDPRPSRGDRIFDFVRRRL